MTRLGRTVGVARQGDVGDPETGAYHYSQSVRRMRGLGVHSTGQKSEVKKSPEGGAEVSGVQEGCRQACRPCRRSTLGVVR